MPRPKKNAEVKPDVESGAAPAEQTTEQVDELEAEAAEEVEEGTNAEVPEVPDSELPPHKHKHFQHHLRVARENAARRDEEGRERHVIREASLVELEKHLAAVSEEFGPNSEEADAVRREINQVRYTK